MKEINWEDFEKLEIRTGTIIKAEPFQKAKKSAYKLLIDFGDSGIRKSSAQITTHYLPDELTGLQIIAVVNFPPKQVADYLSECLVLGIVQDDGSVILLHPGKPVTNGLRIA